MSRCAAGWRLPGGKLSALSLVAGACGIALAAETAPARLIGVAAERGAVVIEATAPVAYSVSRPDATTLVVELRNVTIADAEREVEGHELVAAVTLQEEAALGGPVARVRVAFTRPVLSTVQSARNRIRVELAPAPHAAARVREGVPLDALLPAQNGGAAGAAAPAATRIEAVRAAASGRLTTVTLVGDGRLTPANVVEARDPPRRLVLDFAEVDAQAPAVTDVSSGVVSRVRVGVNSRAPLVTRVVMEIADGTTYHVERTGAGGRDLAVVFEAPAAAASSGPREPADAGLDVVPLPQAVANGAALAPVEPVGVDPIAALKTAAPPAQAVPVPASVPAPPAQSSALRQPQPAGGQIVSGTPQRKYVGAPITLDFSGADLRSVLRVFTDPSGLNILIDPQVPNTPQDFVLKDIPWDQALEIVLRANQLGYEIDGTVIRIAPLQVLEVEQKQRASLAAAQASAGPLDVRTFPLSYAKAEQIAPLLTRAALTDRGQIQVDARTNTLIVKDLAGSLQTAADLIATLDRPEPQVEVEARIVQTTRDFARALGIQWGLNGRLTPEIGNTTNLTFPNRGTIGGRLGSQGAAGTDPRANATDQTGTVVDLGVPAANTAIGLALGAVNGAFNLDVALSALERSGKGRVLSTPRLTTQNNVSAEIAQGVEIPIQTVANNTVIVSFKDATLKLIVTPQITAANTVIMQIEIQNATPDFSREVNGIPPIDTQRAVTRVQVDDGATTVIGGIFVSREQAASDRTPLLSRIPLLGWLFRRESITDESRELLIFITPRISRG